MLLKGIEEKNIPLIEEALRQGEDSNLYLGLPLQFAVQIGSIPLATTLLRYGANINLNPRQTLIPAVSNNEIEMVEFLLKNGIDIHTNAELPLLSAIYSRNLPMANLLLREGANPNGRPLIRAVELGFIGMVELLLNYGATVEEELIEIATKNKNFEMARLLIQSNSKKRF